MSDLSSIRVWDGNNRSGIQIYELGVPLCAVWEDGIIDVWYGQTTKTSIRTAYLEPRPIHNDSGPLWCVF